VIESDRGLVLRSYPLRETSKILCILGARHGRLRLVAHGARAATGRASTEAGNEIEFVFSQKPGAELGTLREATLAHAWLAGSRRLEVLGAGLAALELLDRLIPEGASEPDLLGEALGCLGSLRSSPDRASALLVFYSFELRLLSRLGARPDLVSCRECGRVDHDLFYLEVDAGALRCSACGAAGPGRMALPGEAARVLRVLAGPSWDEIARLATSPRIRRAVGVSLHRLLGAHLERYRLPRSLRLLKNVDRGMVPPGGGRADLPTS
jgi:DNA repair protein RecO (recombination protein O)